MKKLLIVISVALMVLAACGQTKSKFATSGSSDIEGAVKDFKAAYPAINWKGGKLLNGATSESIKEWIETLK